MSFEIALSFDTVLGILGNLLVLFVVVLKKSFWHQIVVV